MSTDLVRISYEPYRYGTNVNRGCIGFTYHADPLSEAISWFERWETLLNVRVTHVFIVTDQDELVESHMENGVARGPISKYLNDSKCATFFRQPLDYSSDLGNRIAAACEAKIGSRYGTPLIVADALADTVLGHLINEVLKDKPEHILNDILARPGEFICSQLAAYGLNQQPEYAGKGCLAQGLSVIDPQKLFEDAEIFEPGAIMAVRP